MAQSPLIIRPADAQTDDVLLPLPVGGGGGGGGAGVSFRDYLLAAVSSTGDPSGILNGSPTTSGVNGEFIDIAVDTPGTACPPAGGGIGGAYLEWLAKDLSGDDAGIRAEDLTKHLMWMASQLPVDGYVAIAATEGGVASAANKGWIGGLRHHASGPQVFTYQNSGSGWVTLVSGTAYDALVRGVMLTFSGSNSAAAGRMTCDGMDAYGIRSSLTLTSGTPASGNPVPTWNGEAGWTHLALVVGWTTGVGGPANHTHVAALRGFQEQPRDIPGMLWELPPISVTLPAARVVIVGDSNGNGTQVDATHGGNAIPAGWIVRDIGVNLAVWPNTGTPGTGMMPYLIADLIAAGVVSGNRYIVRRANNGADTTWPGTIRGNIEAAFADVDTLALGDPDAVVFVFGANDANNGVPKGRQYLHHMRRAIQVVQNRWPNARLVFCQERTLDSVTYAELDPVIYGHIVALAAEARSGAYVSSLLPSVTTMADNIHWSSDGAGSGQDTIAGRVAAEITP